MLWVENKAKSNLKIINGKNITGVAKWKHVNLKAGRNALNSKVGS